MVNRNITVTPGQTTIIKKIKVGTPVRRIREANFNLNELLGVNTVGKVNGSVLVYNASSGDWEATLDLEEQNINGGQF